MLALVSPGAGPKLVAVGTTVSMVNGTTSETGETLPDASVALALMLCAPSESGVLGVKVQLPLPSVLAVPIRFVPS